MSSSVRVPAEWNGTIDKIVARIQRRPVDPARPGPTDCSRQPLLTGLIHGPQASGKSRTIPPAIQNALADSTTLVVHVSNQLEVGLLNQATDGSAPNLGFSLHRASYEGFLQILRLNTAANSQHGQGDGRRAWLQSGILPPKVVILVEEDTSLSASFCLMLVELLGWAGAISQRPGLLEPLAISILIMGCSDSDVAWHSFLERTQLAVHRSSPVSWWSLPRPVPQGQYTVSNATLDQMKYDIDESFMQASESPVRMGVFCFPPWDRIEDIAGPGLEQFRVSEDTILTDFEFMFQIKHGGNGPFLRVIYLPHDFRAPLQLEGCNCGIVLVSPHIEQDIIDGLTGRLTSSVVRISKAQQLEQESWAYRFQCPANNVIVHRDTTNSGLPKRAKTGNEHLAGFLAALSMSEYGSIRMATHAKRIFCTDPSARKDRMMQLTQMRICRISGISESLLEPRLTGSIRSSFCELLPMFNYDPRLALFVALPCTQPQVAHVKLQLAALIKVNLKNIFFPTITPETNEAEFRWQLSQHVCGYTKRIAFAGSLWAILAIWKAAAIRSQLFSSENIIVNQRATVDVGAGLVKVNIASSRAAIDLMLRAAKLLEAHQGVQIQPTNLDENDSEWTQGCMREIHHHLMTCFAHSAVLAIPPAAETGEDSDWRFADVPSRRTALPSLWKALVDLEACVRAQKSLRQGTTTLFGLSLGAFWRQGEVCVRFVDWTWILPSELKDWFEANRHGQSINDALRTQCVCSHNADGL